MQPDEIAQAYEVLANNLRDQAANQAAIIGNSQRSLGPLAERVASPSGQTSGLANYTYNRAFRPAVETATQNLITAGYAQRLDQYLSDQLRAAKNKYENSRNAAASGSNNGNGNGNGAYKESEDQEYTVKQVQDENGNYYPPEGTILGRSMQQPHADDAAYQAYLAIPGAYDFLGVTNPNIHEYVYTVADGKNGYYLEKIIARSQEEADNMFYQKHPKKLSNEEAMNKIMGIFDTVSQFTGGK